MKTPPRTPRCSGTLILAGTMLVTALRCAPLFAGAATDAWQTPMPAVPAKTDDTLAGFGGARTDVPAADLYADGMGSLYDPAVEEVVRCRSETDPTCRAVQVLDRGFPERPEIPDRVLTARDDVVNNAVLPETAEPGTTGCRPVTVTTAPHEETATCSAGAPYSQITCLASYESHSKVTAKYFGCSKTAAVSRTATCPVTVTTPTATQFTERCAWGLESTAAGGEVVETTTAKATARFPAVCTAPQATVKTVTCSEMMIRDNTTACEAGSVVSVFSKDATGLAAAHCPDSDTLTLSHTCGSKTVLFALNGYNAYALSPGITSSPVRHGVKPLCNVKYAFTGTSCTDTACIADGKALIYYNKTLLGTIETRLTYPNPDAVEITWQDNCKPYKDEAAQ